MTDTAAKQQGEKPRPATRSSQPPPPAEPENEIDLNKLYTYIRENDWQKVLVGSKCLEDGKRPPFAFKFMSYKLGALTSTQKDRLTKWLVGLPNGVQEYIKKEMSKINTTTQEKDEPNMHSNKHDMCRLIHLMQDPEAQPHWAAASKGETEDDTTEVAWKNLTDMYNDNDRQYQNFCVAYVKDPKDPKSVGKRKDAPNNVVKGLERVYSKCADLEPCREVKGALRPTRDVNWLRGKYHDLTAEGLKAFRKYKSSGDKALHEIDTMLNYLEKSSRKLEIWYMFTYMGFKGLEKLEKIGNIAEIVGKDDSTTEKKDKVYSQKADAIRKRGYRALQKEEAARDAEWLQLQSKRIKLEKFSKKEEAKRSAFQLAHDAKMAQIKTEGELAMKGIGLVMENMDKLKKLEGDAVLKKALDKLIDIIGTPNREKPAVEQPLPAALNPSDVSDDDMEVDQQKK
eukprot:m.13180 g.13180  ORF g.13180 m.13180 type:complete len:454 (+) comp4801_c0_seq1:81-1442(+)